MTNIPLRVMYLSTLCNACGSNTAFIYLLFSLFIFQSKVYDVQMYIFFALMK